MKKSASPKPASLAFLPAALLIAVVSLLPTTARAVLLTNGDFEASSGYSGGLISNVSAWATVDGVYGDIIDATTLFSSGLTGPNAIHILGNISQTAVPVFQAGLTYRLSLDLGNPLGGTANANGFQFGFRNSANAGFIAGAETFLDPVALNAIPDGTFQTFTIEYVAQVTDAGNPVTVFLTDFFEPAPSAIRVDNVVLTAVPEPTATALMLLGLAGMVVWRSAKGA